MRERKKKRTMRRKEGTSRSHEYVRGKEGRKKDIKERRKQGLSSKGRWVERKMRSMERESGTR